MSGTQPEHRVVDQPASPVPGRVSRFRLRRLWWTLLWVTVFVGVVGGIYTSLYLYRAQRYNELIDTIALEHHVDPQLVRALIWRESRFDASAVGGVGEVGLMQVTETVGREWAAAADRPPPDRDELIAPEYNIRVGTWYLAQALGQWNDKADPVPYALAQYNAGRSNALRWSKDDGNNPRAFMEKITYPGTHQYILDVLQRYRKTTGHPHPIMKER